MHSQCGTKCVAEQRIVLPEDIRDALREMGHEPGIPAARSSRFLEMAEALSMFCMGTEGDMFNRPGTPWPEADITIVDLATYAREATAHRWPSPTFRYSTQSTTSQSGINSKAAPDLFTDEGHIQLKVPLLSPTPSRSPKCGESWEPGSGWPLKTLTTCHQRHRPYST